VCKSSGQPVEQVRDVPRGVFIMGFTNYTHGVTSFGVPIFGGGGPIGLGMGKLRYVVASRASATNLYYAKLKKNGVRDGDIFTTLAAAYAATTGDQNDVIAVTPGAYLETAELAWAKSATHLVGLGGPNTNGDFYEPNCVIYTSGIAVASTITVTGNNCQFINMTFANYGNNAACLTPFTLDSYGCYFSACTFQGNMTTNQNTTAAAASLYIAGGGMYPIFDNCTIGQDVWGERSGANSGQLRFSDTGQPNGGWLRNCRIPSRSMTATCAAVSFSKNGCIGRGWTFDNCIFQNEYATPFTALNNVFYDNDLAGQSILLKDCVNMGYSEWQAGGAGVDRRIFSNMGVASLGGGICIDPSGTIA
jgi:hypothetical protein